MPSAATGVPWKWVSSWGLRSSITICCPVARLGSRVVVGAATKNGILQPCTGLTRCEVELVMLT